MKTWVGLCLLALTGLSSCSKNAVDQAKVDHQLIQAYIQANHLSAVKDSSGLYFQIENPGTGSAPNLQSNVTVTYTGKLLNGTVFDSESNLSVVLGNTITGWQIGLPKIKAGGSILLLIPSGLAYGPNASGAVPPNSVLVFDIKLISVQ